MPNKVNAESIGHDQRILSRKLSKGEMSEKDFQSLLKKLPDVSDNAEEVTLEEKEK
jgi:hypothetical protein